MYGEEQDHPFLGQSMGMGGSKLEFSDATANIIDEEVRALIDRNYERAKKILHENTDILHTMAEALIKFETLDASQVEDLMSRRPMKEPEPLPPAPVVAETKPANKDNATPEGVPTTTAASS
jgi:cell division protease FtsH